MTPEKQIQNAIIAHLGCNDRLRIWRQNTGVFLTLDGRDKVSVGVPGAADLSGIMIDGRRLEIEVKTETGRQSLKQERYMKMIRAMNGIYILTRSLPDCLKQLKRAGYDLT